MIHGAKRKLSMSTADLFRQVQPQHIYRSYLPQLIHNEYPCTWIHIFRKGIGCKTIFVFFFVDFKVFYGLAPMIGCQILSNISSISSLINPHISSFQSACQMTVMFVDPPSSCAIFTFLLCCSGSEKICTNLS